MPRIRQYAERYAVEDFWKEIDRCCPLAGIQSNNAAALGRGIGVRKLVTTLHPNPAVILKTLGYSEKEIRAFARELQ